MTTTPTQAARVDSAIEASPRTLTEMRTVLGRLVGRSQSRSKTSSKAENHHVTALIGGSKRPHERSPSAPPGKVSFCSTPSPKRRRANAVTRSPLRPHTTPGSSMRGSPSPAKPLPSAPLAPSIPLPESPLQVDFEGFDELFADFPAPPSATMTNNSTIVSLSISSKYTDGASGQQVKSGLSGALRTVEQLRIELEKELVAEQSRVQKEEEKDAEIKRLRSDIEAYRSRVSLLEGNLAEKQDVNVEALDEANQVIAQLEARLAKEQEDRRLAVEAYNHRQALDATSELRFSNLERQLGDAQQIAATAEATIKAREAVLLRQSKEYREKVERVLREREAEWAQKLAEAEFAHRALKESGAKLAKELAAKERIVEGMEKRMKGYI